MGQISLQIPQVGLPDSTEDPKVASDLSTIQTLVNGNLDPSNLSATGGVMSLAYRLGSTSLALAAGDFCVATAGTTQTLPAPAANAMVAVQAGAFVAGSNPVTVAGTNIFGVGLNGVSSFVLGKALSTAVLRSDGTNWLIVAGGEDSGWVALTLGGNVTNTDTPSAAARRIEGRVWLRGTLVTTGTVNSNVAFATIPSGSRPAATTGLPLIASANAAPSPAPAFGIAPSGQITAGVNVAANVQVSLNGISYSLATT